MDTCNPQTVRGGRPHAISLDTHPQGEHNRARIRRPAMQDENAKSPQDEQESKPPPPYEHPAAAFYREHAAEMARRRPFLPKMISVPDPHPRDPTMDPPQTITYIDPNQ